MDPFAVAAADAKERTLGWASVHECSLRRLRFKSESGGSTGIQPATCSQSWSLCAFA
jgi:hypothetical protein